MTSCTQPKKSRWRNQIHSLSETFKSFNVDDDSVEEVNFEAGLGTEEELGSHPYMFEPETTTITTIQKPWNRAVSIGKTNLGVSLSLRWRYILIYNASVLSTHLLFAQDD